jgi:cell division protease FtsH
MNQTEKKNQKSNSPIGEDPNKKKNKFNIYWIYGIVFLCIISYNLFRGVDIGGVEISYPNQYQQMLNNGDVKSIKIISNKKLVRIFVAPDSLKLKSAFYKSIISPKGDEKRFDVVTKSTSPQFYFTISDVSSFNDDQRDYFNNNKTIIKPDVSSEDEGELLSQIISTLLPILLIGFIFVMMMRKVGPGGGGGRVASIKIDI